MKITLHMYYEDNKQIHSKGVNNLDHRLYIYIYKFLIQ